MPVIGYGATISVNDGSGSTGSASAAVVDIVSLTVPDVEVGVVESKRVNLTNRYIEKLAALKDPGQFSFVYEFSTGKKTRLDSLIGSSRVFVITLPTDAGSTWTRTTSGFIVSNKSDNVAADQIQTCTCTVQCTGEPS